MRMVHMQMRRALASGLILLLMPVASVLAQNQPVATDMYHVHFTKAVPGQAAALAAQQMQQDPKDPMASHFLMLRHVEGDDWDYLVIRHLGPKPTVEIGPAPDPKTPAVNAWHSDTFAAGPSWAEFSKAMGVSAGAPAGSVYVASVHRAVPGHRAQLLAALDAPSGKVPVSHLTLAHVEGGPWTFLSLDRYNSWADFAAAQTANAASVGSGKDDWSEIRQHSGFHMDTLATRMVPK